MEKYNFKTTHRPLSIDQGLYKLSKNRPNEWEVILHVLESNSEDFKLLSDNEDPQKWLQKAFSSWSLGMFLEQSLTKLEATRPLNLLLCDLIDDYSPIKLRQEDLEPRVVHSELGKNVSFTVGASGSPSLKFNWFFWPSHKEAKDWIPLKEVSGKEIRIDDLRLEDVGIYKCFVEHSLNVVDDNGTKVQGMFTNGLEIIIDPDSILIVKNPEDIQCHILDEISFECQAESTSSLSYQWFLNDQVMVGECSSRLILKAVTLDDRGLYKCTIKTQTGASKTSDQASLHVEIPSAEDFQKLEFENEEIKILEQPQLSFHNVKAAIGEKVRLTCLAACKYPLRYEWIRRGVRTDLVAKSGEVYSETELVSLSCEMIDEIEDVHPPVSFYVYQCIVRCIETDERVVSNVVKIPVSTFTLPDKSLPRFKIALLICQEDYDHHGYFQKLYAPKSDGRAMAKALQEIDFDVMLFSNLTVAEIHHAVDIFCSLIDEHTYAFFYFNGHALGHGSDIYLVGKDTTLDGTTPVMKQLVWHGEIETALDKCRPLFATIIYDSCRDQLPQHVSRLIKESSREFEPIVCESNFCIGYGTRQSMRSFVKVDKSGLSQSLYTKYLLQHIKTKNISVGAMFERLNCSFTINEDASIVAQMKPEFKDSTMQSFSVSAPLRHSFASKMHKKYFKLCRIEALTSSTHLTDSQLNVQLGLQWCQETHLPIWIKGKTYKAPEVMIKLALKPGIILNEAHLEISVNVTQRTWVKDSVLQVVPENVNLSVPSMDQGPDLHFAPVNVDSAFSGASFNLCDVLGEKGFEVISLCHLPSLQRVPDPVLKFRIVLMYQMYPIPCKGIITFPMPICKNMPGLKINV